jgi:S-methylmethionine-dependent homocysteine/selenocysteine methylase
MSVSGTLDGLWLADGGIETDLMFHHGCTLPEFAAFVLLDQPAGLAALRSYYLPYLELARAAGTGLVLETPTWRASSGWGDSLGYDSVALADLNRRAVAMLRSLRDEVPTGAPVEISGCVGPMPETQALTIEQAQCYHRPQIEALAHADADRLTAMTVSDPAEAVGIVRAARAVGVTSVISLTVEADGLLAGGLTLADTIEQVDYHSDGGPQYYMLNCAHPEHIQRALGNPGPWLARLQGLRPNASRRTHTELDEATDLDVGDRDEFGAQCRKLREAVPSLRVVGGCCGTDIGHIRAVVGR